MTAVKNMPPTKSAAQAVREMREAESAQVAHIARSDEQVPKPCDHATVDVEPKCNAVNASNGQMCGRVLAGKMGRPWEIRCQRCGSLNSSESRG